MRKFLATMIVCLMTMISMSSCTNYENIEDEAFAFSEKFIKAHLFKNGVPNDVDFNVSKVETSFKDGGTCAIKVNAVVNKGEDTILDETYLCVYDIDKNGVIRGNVMDEDAYDIGIGILKMGVSMIDPSFIPKNKRKEYNEFKSILSSEKKTYQYLIKDDIIKQ